MKTSYRNSGAKGALLDEYEKAIIELNRLLNEVTPEQLLAIVDSDTKDKDCRSIQTIVSHVISAGYNYVIAIRKWKGETIAFYPKQLLPSITQYQAELKQMFAFNEQLFQDYLNIEIEVHEEQNKIVSSWGQSYDVEQLFEHAIVHVLRHRRQIERFLLILNKV